MYAATTAEQYMWMGRDENGPLSKNWFKRWFYKIPSVISVSFMVPSRDPDNMTMGGTLKLQFINAPEAHDNGFCHSKAQDIFHIFMHYVPVVNHVVVHAVEVLCMIVHF